MYVDEINCRFCGGKIVNNLKRTTQYVSTFVMLRFLLVLLRWRKYPKPVDQCACGSEPWIFTPESSKKLAPREQNWPRHRSVIYIRAYACMQHMDKLQCNGKCFTYLLCISIQFSIPSEPVPPTRP